LFWSRVSKTDIDFNSVFTVRNFKLPKGISFISAFPLPAILQAGKGRNLCFFQPHFAEENRFPAANMFWLKRNLKLFSTFSNILFFNNIIG